MSKKIQFGKISANFSKNNDTIEPTGTIGKSTVVVGQKTAIEVLEDDTEHQEMKEVMGISSFGKKAKTFNIKVVSPFKTSCTFIIYLFRRKC